MDFRDFINFDTSSDIYHGSLDMLSQKMSDLYYTNENKKSMLKYLGIQKSMDMTGYEDIEATFSDGDSGYYRDKNGHDRPFRLADFNRLDTADLLQSQSDYKRQKQPDYIAKMYGTTPDQLTDWHYFNADNYHRYAAHQQITTGKHDSFNPALDYSRMETPSVPLKFRVVGKDRYGRDLVEAYNPVTQSHVSREIGDDPELNVEFNFYNSLGTQENQSRYDKFLQHGEDYREALAKARERQENRFGEDIDMIQSSAYQTAARVLQYFPSWLVDKEKWQKIADPVTGQAIADRWAGVDPLTREDYNLEMGKALREFKEGKTTAGIFTLAKNVDKLLAESAVQTGLAVGGSFLTGGLAGAAGLASGIGRTLLSGLGGGILAGTDETLMAMEEYKKRHHGKSMPAEQAALNFIGNVALLMPEAIFAASGLERVAKGIIRSGATKFQDGFWKDAAKNIAKAGTFEWFQERAQNTWNEYHANDNLLRQGLAKGLYESWNMPEQQLTGWAGGLAGMAMSGINTSIIGAANLRGNIQANNEQKTIEKVAKEQDKVTAIGTRPDQQADIDASNACNAAHYYLKGQYKMDEAEKFKTIKELQKFMHSDKISDKHNRMAAKLAGRLLMDIINNTKTPEEAQKAVEKAGYQSREEAFKELIANAHPNSFNETLNDEGKPLTKEYVKQEEKKLSEIGRKLGLDDDTIVRTMKSVAHQIQYGLYGYRNYAGHYKQVTDELANPDLTQEERDKLLTTQSVYEDKLRYLARNQLDKMEQFTDAVAEIESGKRNEVTLNWKSRTGKPFTINAADLIVNNYESGKGASSVFHSLVEETRNMYNFLESIKENIGQDVLGSDLQEKVDYFEKKYINSVDAIYDRSRHEVKNAHGLSDDTILSYGLSDPKTIRSLQRLVSDKTDSKTKAAITSELSNLSNLAYSKMESILQRPEAEKKIPQAKQILKAVQDIRQNQESFESRQKSKEQEEINPVEKKQREPLEVGKPFNSASDNTYQGKVLNNVLDSVFSEQIESRSYEPKKLRSDLARVRDSIAKESKISDKDKAKLDQHLDAIVDYLASNQPKFKQQTSHMASQWNQNSEVKTDKRAVASLLVHSVLKESMDKDRNAKSTAYAIEQIATKILRDNWVKDDKPQFARNVYAKLNEMATTLNHPMEARGLISSEFSGRETPDFTPLLKEYAKTKSAESLQKLQEQMTIDNAREAYNNADKMFSPEEAETVKSAMEHLFAPPKSGETTVVDKTPKGTPESPITIYAEGSNKENSPEYGYGAYFTHNKKDYSLSGTELHKEFKSLQEKYPDSKPDYKTMKIMAVTRSLETIAKTGIGENIRVIQDYKALANYLWKNAPNHSGRDTKAWTKIKDPLVRELVRRAKDAIRTIEKNGGSVDIYYHPSLNKAKAKTKSYAFAQDRNHFNTFAKLYGMEPDEVVVQDSSVSGTTMDTQPSSDTSTQSTTVSGTTKVEQGTTETTPKPDGYDKAKADKLFDQVFQDLKDNPKTTISAIQKKYHVGFSRAKALRAAAAYDHSAATQPIVAQGTENTPTDTKEKSRWDAFDDLDAEPDEEEQSKDLDNKSEEKPEKSRWDAYDDLDAEPDDEEAAKDLQKNPEGEPAENKKPDSSRWDAYDDLDAEFDEEAAASELKVQDEYGTATDEAIAEAKDKVSAPFSMTEQEREIEQNYIEGLIKAMHNAYFDDQAETAPSQKLASLVSEQLLAPNRFKFKDRYYQPGKFGKEGRTYSSKEIMSRVLHDIFKALRTTQSDLSLSKLATEGVAKEDQDLLDDYIAQVLNEQKLNPSKDVLNFKGEKIQNLSSILFGTPDKHFYHTDNTAYKYPQFFMFYNATENNNGTVNLTVNPLTAFAIRLSTMDYLSNHDLKSLQRPDSDSALGAIFSLDEAGKSDYMRLSIYKDIMKNYGTPVASLATTLGRTVLKALGFSNSNDKSAMKGMYDKIVEGLGQVAVNAMVAEGLVVKQEMTAENIAALIDKNKGIPTEEKAAYKELFKNDIMMVKPVRDSKGEVKDTSKLTKTYEELKKRYGLQLDHIVVPKVAFTNPNMNTDIYARNTSQMSKIPAYNREAMQEQQKVKFVPASDIIERIKAIDPEFTSIKKRNGVMTDEEMNWMSKDLRESQKGINLAVNREIETVIAFYDEFTRMQHDENELAKMEDRQPRQLGMFFKTFFSANGRIFYDSNTLNPQTGKKITRFLYLPQDFKRTYKSIGRDFEVYALAQSFDALSSRTEHGRMLDYFNSLSKEKLEEMFKDVMALTAKEFEEKYKDTGFKLGIENQGQCLNTLDHFIGKKEGRTYSWLAVEMDSTTSGYFIRETQFPHPTVTGTYKGGDPLISKLGIMATRMDNYELKKSPGFLDVYKTTAKNASDTLRRFSAIKPGQTKQINMLFMDSKIDSTQLFNIFHALSDALPKAKPDGTVSSELRTLIKDPTMVFGYNAGETSTKKALTRHILDDLVKKYMKCVKDKTFNTPEEKAIKSAFEQLRVTDGVSIAEALKFRTMDKIWVEVTLKDPQGGKGTKSVRPFFTVMNDVLGNTYGKAVWDSLDELYAGLKPYSQAMNVMFSNAARMFSYKVEDYLQDLWATKKRFITNNDFNKAVEMYKDLMPRIPTYYNGNLDDGAVSLLRYEKATGDSFNNWNEVKNFEVTPEGLQKETHSYAQGKKFAVTKNAGAVIPIHYIDGMGMARMIHLNNAIIPVHDAIVCPASEASRMSQAYNTTMYALGMDYNMFQETVNMMERVADKLDELANSEQLNPERVIRDSRHEMMKDSYNTKELSETVYLPIDPSLLPDFEAQSQDLGKTPTFSQVFRLIQKFNNMSKPENRTAYAKPKCTFTFREYVDYAKLLMANNNLHRDSFYREDHWVANMDGVNGSAHVNSKSSMAQDEIKNYIQSSKSVFSNAKGFMTSGETFNILANGIADTETRVNTAEQLWNLAGDVNATRESPEHLEHLKGLLGNLHFENVPDIKVQYSMDFQDTQGEFNHDKRLISLGFYDNSKNNVARKALAAMPFATTYTHEVVHAATLAALSNPQKYGINAQVDQLLGLYSQWVKHSSWEDLMPEHYDPALKAELEANAKESYEYITNPKKFGYDPDIALAEWVAYASTHETLVNKIKDWTPEAPKKTTFIQSLVKLLGAIWHALVGHGSFRAVPNAASALIMRREFNPYDRDMSREINRLIESISKANSKAAQRLQQHPARWYESIYEGLSNKIRGVNQWIGGKLEDLSTSLDKKHPYNWNLGINESRLSSAARIFSIAPRALFSQTARDSFSHWVMKTFNQNQTSWPLALLRDIGKTDRQTNALNMINTNARLIEQQGKHVENVVIGDIIESGFDGRQPTELEHRAMLKGVLNTDLQALFKNGYTIDRIKELLFPQSLEEEITKLEQSIGKAVSSKDLNFILNQANFLSRYMMEGKGNEAQYTNAEMILRHKNYGHTTDMEKQLDNLITLYAIRRMKPEDRKVLFTIPDKAIETTMRYMKEYYDNAYNGIDLADEEGVEAHYSGLPVHQIVKGYTKPVFNPSMNIKVDFVSNYDDLYKDGYNLRHTFRTDENKEVPDLALYTQNFANIKRRDGTSFLMQGQNAMMEVISSSALRMAKQISGDYNYNPKDPNYQRYRSSFETHAQRINKAFHERLVTDEEMDKMSMGFLPVMSFDDKGNLFTSDYQLSVSHDIRENVLGMEQNFLSSVGRLFSSQRHMASSDTHNRIIMDFLYDDMMENMDNRTHTSKDGKIKYTKLTRSSDNKFIQKAAEIIPKFVWNYAEKKDLYVREDWLLNLLGNESISMTDYMKNWPRFIKQATRFAEYICKIAASYMKSNILLKVPKVLIGNIMSNFMYSFMQGHRFDKVITYTFKNFTATKQYIDDVRRIDQIHMRQRLGTATQGEIAQLPVLMKKLQNNRVYPLMRKGMFTTVIEDLSSRDMDYLKKLSRAFGNNKIAKQTPDKVKWGLKQLYMGEGTPFYEAMNALTMYSDFASRCTEYQLRMEKAPAMTIEKKINGKKVIVPNPEYQEFDRQLTQELWEAFVNYDTPQSSGLQYLNDMGITMFTKYAFRIQKILRSQMFKNPIGALTFLLSNMQFQHMDSVMEQNVFSKHWTALFHNPVTNIMDSLIPMPIQYWTGHRKLQFLP